MVLLISGLQGFIQDFRFGGETQHLGGLGACSPRKKILRTNALRLILGHFLVHMHILSFIQEVMHSCITEGKVVVM